jgi:predicted Zn finger-like uncharacterized protein
MAMLTRCPSCSATFRVTTDQLVAKQGKVRCGECKEVFSALKSLVHEYSQNLSKSQQISTLSMPVSGATGWPAASGEDTVAGPDSIAPPELPALRPSASAVGVSSTTTAMPPAPPRSSADEPTVPQPQPHVLAIEITRPGGAVVASTDLPAPASLGSDLARVATPITDAVVSANNTANEASAQALQDTSAPALEPDASPVPPPSFLNTPAAPTRMGWGSKLVYGMAALLLLAFGIVQANALWHTDIVRAVPETKPYSAQLCGVTKLYALPFTCKTLVRQNAKEITVEASELSNDGRAVLAVFALLKNRAPYAQPFPQLEVTLFDGADQVITRRVLDPKTYAEKSEDTKGEFAPAGELSVRFLVDAKELKPARYQLYVFHP